MFSTLVLLKFIYSEKATKFCEIFPLLLTTVHSVKIKGKILQNFVAYLLRIYELYCNTTKVSHRLSRPRLSVATTKPLIFRVRIETTNFEWYFGKCSSRFSSKHFI